MLSLCGYVIIIQFMFMLDSYYLTIHTNPRLNLTKTFLIGDIKMIRQQIENVFFNLTIENKKLDVNVAYTFLSESIEEELKANEDLNFKVDLTFLPSVKDIKLLFNIDVPNANANFMDTEELNINVDFMGTEELRKANKETLDVIKVVVKKLAIILFYTDC